MCHMIIYFIYFSPLPHPPLASFPSLSYYLHNQHLFTLFLIFVILILRHPFPSWFLRPGSSSWGKETKPSRNGTWFPHGEVWIQGKRTWLEVACLTKKSLFTFFVNLSSGREKALHFWHRILYPQLEIPWRLLIHSLLWFRITTGPTIRKFAKRCGLWEVSRLKTKFDRYQKPDCG